MKKFEGYDTAKAFEDFERLELGGHIIKILEANVQTITTKDGETFDRLNLKIDMADNDKQAGFFARKFAKDAEQDEMNAKWKGNFSITIPQDGSPDTSKSAFKTFTTSLEKSNPGYTFNWEEKQLPGKVLGGVFGLEEFENQNGEVICFSKCKFVRSTEKIEEVQPPKVKLVDGNLMDYKEYCEKKKAERESSKNDTTTESSNSKFVGDNDDLPF